MPSESQLSDVLSEFARTMVTDSSIQGILDHLVERIFEIMPITAAGVTLISPGVEPRNIAASSATELQVEKLQTEHEEGPCLAAYRSGRAISVLDLSAKDRFPAFASMATEVGLVAVFTFPLSNGEHSPGGRDLFRTLARVSGDEFIVLCKDLDGPAHAEAIVVRLDAALDRPFVTSGTAMNGSASIGIASAGHGPEAPEDILHCADLATYRAKRAGGGRHEVFDLSDRRLASGEAGLERDLRDPLRGGELHLDYQPIVATSDGRVRGVEALLRWAHPSHGLVPPSVLIPLAERARLIPAIGKWVLETAMAEQAHWQHDYGVNDVAIAVNVSAHQLMSAGFVDAVAALLERSPSDPGQLILEMTESVFVRDDQRALLVLDDLKALGVKLALDDFGTGCSSLTHLLQFPVDIVKIDRVFVAGLGHDDANQAIVSTVTKLAHNLGLTVVAEGVETLEQYQAIVELCSDLCQGFYLAHPMPGAQLDVLIERGANGSNQSLRYSLAPKPSRASLGPADLLKSSWSRRRDAHQPVLLGARTGDEQGASTATMGIRPTLPPAYAR